MQAALHTHTHILGEHAPAGRYTVPQTFSAGLDQVPLSAPPAHAHFQPIEPEHLRDLRKFVTEHADQHGIDLCTLTKLLIAVTEAATNALTHGRPPAALRLWNTEDYLICEITDHGHWQPDALLGLLPPTSTPSRFGIWGMRMLTDVAQIRTCQPGTLVRLHTRLPTPQS